MAAYEATINFEWERHDVWVDAVLSAKIDVEINEEFTQIDCTVSDIDYDVTGITGSGGLFVDIVGFLWGTPEGYTTDSSGNPTSDSFENAWSQVYTTFPNWNDIMIWALALEHSVGSYQIVEGTNAKTYTQATTREELENGVRIISGLTRYYSQADQWAVCTTTESEGVKLPDDLDEGDILYYPWALYLTTEGAFISCDSDGHSLTAYSSEWVDKKNGLFYDTDDTVHYYDNGWQKALLIGD